MKYYLFGALLFVVSLVVTLVILIISKMLMPAATQTTHGLGYSRAVLPPIFWTAGGLYLVLGFAIHYGLKGL